MTKYLMIALGLCFSLSACNESDFLDSMIGPDLKTVSVTTNHGGVDNEGVMLVRPDLDDGRFTVEWHADWSSSNNTAVFEFYLAPQGDLHSRELVFDTVCGKSDSYDCNRRGAMTCGLGNDGMLTCGSEVFDARKYMDSSQPLVAKGNFCLFDEGDKYFCSDKTVETVLRFSPAP